MLYIRKKLRTLILFIILKRNGNLTNENHIAVSHNF